MVEGEKKSTQLRGHIALHTENVSSATVVLYFMMQSGFLLCITYSVIKSQFLSYHTYIVYGVGAVKDPSSL